MRNLLRIATCCAAIISTPAYAANDDPWGPLDDMVGKRYEQRYVSVNAPVFEYEYVWEVPGKIIREDIISVTMDGTRRRQSGNSYTFYELDSATGEVVKRVPGGSDNAGTRYRLSRGGLTLEKRSDEFRSTSFTTLRLGADGQIGEYVISIDDRNPVESPPKLRSRYVEVGAAPPAPVGNLSNPFAVASAWGPLSSLANRANFFGQKSLILRVSDDGRYLEFIEVAKDWTRLFGLLRAEGGGRFRFVQINGLNERDHIHEGRLQGKELILGSLIEPGYTIKIAADYSASLGEPVLDASGFGSEKQVWTYKGPMADDLEFTDAQLAPALKSSVEQRARFDEFFTPNYVERARQVMLAKSEALRRFAVEQDARDDEYEAQMAARKAEHATDNSGGILGGFAKGLSEATASNNAMEQSMRDAANRGIATGVAEYARRQTGASSAGGGSAGNISQNRPAPTPRTVTSQAPDISTTAATKVGSDDAMGTLRFMLMVPLVEPINGSNAFCYSNIVTTTSPGWEGKSWGRMQKARAVVEPYEASFLDKCRSRAKLVSENVEISWNDASNSADEPERTSARFRSKGFPQVNIP